MIAKKHKKLRRKKVVFTDLDTPLKLHELEIGTPILTINTITHSVVCRGIVQAPPWSVRNNVTDSDVPEPPEKILFMKHGKSGPRGLEIERAASLGLTPYPDGNLHPEHRTYHDPQPLE